MNEPVNNLPEHIRESCEALWGPFEPDPELEIERRLAEEKIIKEII